MLEEDLDELRAQDRANRAYLRQLMAHPNPSDPDHPEPIEGDEE
jgi:hypothetical protein